MIFISGRKNSAEKKKKRRKAAEEGLSDFDLPPAPAEQEEEPKTKVPAFEEKTVGRKVLWCEKPVYPEWAERQGVTGKVKLKFWILPGGKVCDVEILRSSAWLELDECAIEALRKWRFTSINKPEIKTYNVEFHFSLSPTRALSVYNVDSLSSSELPPVVIQGEDKSYVEIIRTKPIPHMASRGEKRKSIVPPLVNVSLPPKIIYPYKMSPSIFLYRAND